MTTRARGPIADGRLKQDLTSFGRTWFENLKDQGFLSLTAKRERLT